MKKAYFLPLLKDFRNLTVIVIPTFILGALRNSASLNSIGFGCDETKFLNGSIESSSFRGLKQLVLNMFLFATVVASIGPELTTPLLGTFSTIDT